MYSIPVLSPYELYLKSEQLYHGYNTTPINYQLAFDFAELSANKNDFRGLVRLGVYYKNGTGCVKNLSTSNQYFAKAFNVYKSLSDIQKSNADIQLAYALMNMRGHIVPKNVQVATNIYKKLADRNIPLAVYNLAYIYETKFKDMDSALKLYKQSAESGLVIAQTSLGYLYEHGIGVQKNKFLAQLFYKKAIAQGSIEAQKMLSNLTKKC